MRAYHKNEKLQNALIYIELYEAEKYDDIFDKSIDWQK